MTAQTFPHVSASTATHARLNRRQLLAWPVCVLPVLSACGGHSSVPSVPSAPTALSYDTDQALYVVGEAITPNNAHVAGGGTLTFAATPAMPGGLSLNASTGLISGTPTTLQRQATHTVSASNAGGAAQTPLRITVTGRGAWSATATIPGARHYATLAPLAGGKMLVAGGRAAVATNSAEIYDPASATWSAAASMLMTRVDPLSVALLDGRVLVFGGGINNTDATSTAELYDPVANTWTATGSMVESRIRGTAHLLANGKVLVTGGYTATPALTFRNTAEVYDPATGTWSPLATTLAVPRGQHAAALLPGGNTLLIAGGINASGFVSTAELYAVDGTGTTVIPYGVGSNVQQAVVLDDGSVLITSDGSAQSQRFDPLTSTWTASALIGGARGLSTMTLLADGRLLLAGGSNLNTAEIYNPDVNVWTTAAPMAAARRAAVAALLGDGSVLMVSGDSAGGDVNGSERYVP